MNSIDLIAKTMRGQASEQGQAQHTLPGGLTVTLKILAAGDIPTRWQLSLSRWAQQASQTEREVIQRAFGVPAWISYKDWQFEYINGYGVQRVIWDDSVGRRLRLIAQGHLAPGWSLCRWQRLMDRYGVNTAKAGALSVLSVKQLDQIIGEIYHEQRAG